MSQQSPMESYVRGATTPALLEHTIGEALSRAAAQWPDREALVSVHQGIRWTYADFLARVDRLAAGLLTLGLRPGDRVGMWGPNCAEWALVQFATARIGLIQVNINPAYRLSEVEYTLNKVGVKVLVCAERFKTSDYVGMMEELAPEIVQSDAGDIRSARLPHLTHVVQIGGKPRVGWLAFERRRQHGHGIMAGEGSHHRHDARPQRCDQHPVHLGHNRPAQRRHALPPQHPQQRLFRRAWHGAGAG